MAVVLLSILAGAVSATSGIGSVAGPAPASSPASAPGPLASPTGHSAGTLPSGPAAPQTKAKVVRVLTVTPDSGNVTTPVAFSASGYADASAFTLTYENSLGKSATICSGTTSSAGAFSCSAVIPVMSAGAHVFTGTDAKGHTATATFTVHPQLILTPATGLAGTPVTVQGTGFGAKVVGTTSPKVVKFTVALNWSQGVVCREQLSASGGFNCTLTIPPVPGGHQRFYAVDNASNKAMSAFAVVTSLSAGPTAGEIGTNVTFLGTGFRGLATVYVTWTGGRACRTTTLSTGEFDCNFVIPAETPGGQYTFSANDSYGHSASTPFIVTFVKSVPANGPVGTHVTLSAGGFAADSPLTILWGTTQACPTAPTSGVGAFSCSFTIPAGTAGVHSFTATDGAGNSAVGEFTIDPALVPTPTYGPAGSFVLFNGTGFAGDSPVTVLWTGGTACSATTDGTGDFDCGFTVPPGTAGDSYTFTATDASNDVGTGTFVVTYVAVTPSSAPVGASLSISGAGFAPDVGFAVLWGTISVCAGTTTAAGALNCPIAYVIPNATAGPQTLVATDDSPAENTATTTFTITPTLSLSPTSGEVGSLIKFSGTGYAGGSPVSITWSHGTACTTETETDGTLSCGPYTVPLTPVGVYTFAGTDGLDNAASASFTVGPSLTVTPAAGYVGSVVNFTARGFTANAAISLSWSVGSVCAGTTGGKGTFSCLYTIPAAAQGTYPFTASDSSSESSSTNFTIEPLLTASPSSGMNGTLVTFEGTGFLADKSVRVTWSLGTACVATSSSTGGFTCSFSIPPSPGGAYTFTASDGTNSATAPFTVESGLSVTPSRGPVGTSVTFSGGGYAKDGTVDVTWNDGALACSATSLPSGGFSCSFRIPATTPGPKTFTSTDHAGDTSTVEFTVVPSLLPSPTSGPVGTLVTFNGSGFSSDASITVSSPGLASCPATSNVSGSFSCVVTIPATTYGPHEFEASDGLNTADANFTVLAHLSVSPPSGLVGTKVVFTGTGYAAIVGVTVSWADGNACSNTTTSGGAFTCRYTIPSGTPGGAYPFTGADGAGDVAVTTFTVTTSLSVTPGHGEAGTAVTFSGTGYAAATVVSVSWSGGAACSSTASGSGTFSCGYTVPLGTAGGPYTFSAKDTAGDSASTIFVVSFLTASPSGGVPGAAIEFSAGGFAAGSPYTISWTSGTACSGTTSETGTYSCSFTIPPSTAPGSYSFSGTDGTLSAGTTLIVFGEPTVSTPAPSLAAADVGQGVSFSTTAAGGSGTYSLYSWSESLPGLGCSLVNSASILCVPSSAGNYTVSVEVTDSAGDTSATATSAKFHVSNDPTITTPTENVSSSDVGQAVEFSTHGAGGSGGLTYLWSGLPTGCAGTTEIVKCTPSAADVGGSVTVTVTDSNGFSVTSTPLAISVYADPTVTSPSASRPAVDIDQPVTFSVTASGGSGGLSYSWSGLPTGCSGVLTDEVTCTPTAALASTSISVTVTDSNEFRVTSGALPFHVDSDPSVTTPAANRTSADVGQSVSFSTSASGGSGGFSYSWSNLPSGCTVSGATVSCTPTSPAASLSVYVTVTDSNGFSVASPALVFSVYADPTAHAPTASSSTADIDQPVTFSADVSGGASPLVYSWTGLPTGCGGTSATIVCVVTDPSLVGEYSISYTVKDANGYSSGSPSLAFRLDPAPSVSTPTASPSSVDLGQSVTFSTGATGGSGSYTFLWSGLPAGCSGMSDTIVCTPTAIVSAAQISVNVTDSNGFTVTSGILTFTVYAPPAAGTPTASAPSADIGQAVTFSTVVSNGSGGLSYVWTGLPTGCSGTSASVDCAPISTAGTFVIFVTVEDSNGVSNTSANLTYTVFPDPAVTTPVASQPGADVGQTVTFTVTASGGSGALTYSWAGLPGGCSGTTTASVSCTPTAALPSTTITATVTDSNGYSVTSAALSFSVDPALGVTLSVSPSSVLAGASVTFSATVSGGSGGLSYSWSGLPAGCTGGNSASVTCKSSASGAFSVTVAVTDSNKATVKGSTALTVNSSFLGLPSTEGIALLAGAVLSGLVFVVLLAILLVRRRRRAASGGPVPWTPGPSSPPPPSAPSTPPPVAWNPPPAPEEAPPTDEPAPWEMPPAEDEPSGPGTPADGH